MHEEIHPLRVRLVERVPDLQPQGKQARSIRRAAQNSDKIGTSIPGAKRNSHSRLHLQIWLLFPTGLEKSRCSHGSLIQLVTVCYQELPSGTPFFLNSRKLHVPTPHSLRVAGPLARLRHLGQRHGVAGPRGVHEDRPAVSGPPRQVLAHALRWTGKSTKKTEKKKHPTKRSQHRMAGITAPCL